MTGRHAVRALLVVLLTLQAIVIAPVAMALVPHSVAMSVADCDMGTDGAQRLSLLSARRPHEGIACYLYWPDSSGTDIALVSRLPSISLIQCLHRHCSLVGFIRPSILLQSAENR